MFWVEMNDDEYGMCGVSVCGRGRDDANLLAQRTDYRINRFHKCHADAIGVGGGI